MLFKRIAIFVFCIGGCSALPQSSDSTYRALFSNPECAEYEYKVPVTQNDGQIRTRKFGHAFCTAHDLNSQRGDIQRTMHNLLEDRSFDLERVDVASYVFFDSDLADGLCKRFAADPFEMRFIVQHSARRGSLVPDRIITRLQNCLGKRFQLIEVGCDVFHAKECPKKKTNTMHTKLMVFKGAQNGQKRDFIFGGSGNFAEWLKIHFDDMLYMNVPAESMVARKHSCMLDAMAAAGDKQWMEKETKQYYRACTKAVKTNDQPAVVPYFMPAEHDRYLKDLVRSLDTATSIKVALQVLGDAGIRDALIAAAARGADVQLLTDNIWYYISVASDLKPYERQWGKRDVGLLFTHLKPIMDSNAHVQFLETNIDPNETAKNFVHLRFVIVDHAKVFTGSAHMAPGTFRLNYENQYIITDPKVVRAYDDNFDNLWSRSLPTSRMPTTYVPVGRSK